MATSPDFVRGSIGATPLLAEAAFIALREAVVVVDAGAGRLPLLLANVAARQCLMGSAADSAVGFSLYSFLGVATDGAIQAAFDSARAGRSAANQMLAWRFPGGERSIATELKQLNSAPGQPRVMLTFASSDADYRGDGEARLGRSEELLFATTANSADTLLLIDTLLRVRFINRGELGMSIDDIIGQDIGVLLPHHARERIIAKLRRVLTTAEAVSYEFEVEAKGTETQYFENRAVLLREEGIGSCISITVRNITERKRLEREILEVSNRERQTIGRDLHDGLGQELTGVALMLRGLATRIKDQTPDVIDEVNEVVGLVNRSIETAHNLAQGLLPVTAESGGLTVALRSLAARSRELYGIAVDFRTEISAELPLSELNASHLYRIAQEALTNTARHGRASAVEILLVISNSRFLLQVTDDGIGIAQTGRSGGGMGLRIMQYRAGMIGARFEIAAQAPRGTVVRVLREHSLPGRLHIVEAV